MRPGFAGRAVAVLAIVVLVLELTRVCEVVRRAARRAHRSRARGPVGGRAGGERPGGGAYQSGCRRGHQRLADEHVAPPSVGLGNRRGGAFEWSGLASVSRRAPALKTPVRGEGQALSRRMSSAPAITESPAPDHWEAAAVLGGEVPSRAGGWIRRA